MLGYKQMVQIVHSFGCFPLFFSDSQWELNTEWLIPPYQRGPHVLTKIKVSVPPCSELLLQNDSEEKNPW